MSNLSEKDEGNLMNMVEAAKKIQRFTAKIKDAEEIWQIIQSHIQKLIMDISRLL